MPELPMLPPAANLQIPAAVKPPEPTAGAHIAAVGEEGIHSAEQLFWLQREARRDEEAGIAAGKLADYQIGEAQIDKQLATVTDPDAYLRDHQAASKDLRDRTLADLPAGPMRDRIGGFLDEQYARSVVAATHQSLRLQIEAGQDAIKSATQKWARIAATTDDPTLQADAIVHIHKAFDGNKFLRPDEAQEGLTNTLGQVDLMRLQHRVDSNDPNVLMELHDPNFQANHPLITPEQHEALINHGVSQVTAGYRMVEAQMRAEIDANEQRLNAMAAAGQNIGPELERLAPFGGVSPEFYRAHTGHAFTQSMPGVAESFIARLKEAATPEDLDGITQEAYIASDHNQLGSRDLAAINHAAANAKGALRTSAKQQELWGKTQLEVLFPPKDPFMPSFEPKFSREAVYTYFALKMGQHPKDVPLAVQETLDHFRDSRKDGSASSAIENLLNPKK